MKHLLEQAGYVRELQTGIWTREGFSGIAYSDGDEVEQRLARCIAATSDLQVLSDELKQHITDWPSLYHLSGSRANILRPFEGRLAGADVLEIGAGCGAITRYLGESGARVLALEGSARRAAIARSRTRDLPQVDVLAERFDQFHCNAPFDVVTLIGVLEYANQFVPGANPTLAMLQRARALVKPGGLLLIAIENQLGLKYWAGAPEDHLGVPMYGIEGRYRADGPQTHGRARLAGLLAEAGFSRSEFLSPLPDYKFPVSVLTPGGMVCADFDAAALAAQCARRDPQLPSLPAFAIERAWPAVMQNELGADLANSFLIAASASQVPATDPSVLAYHYSTERRREFCKQTVFHREESGSIRVDCSMLAPPEAGQGALLAQHVPARSPYVPGPTLASELAEIVTHDGWTIDAVGEYLQRYLHVVGTLSSHSTTTPALGSANAQLPGACFDLVPQNIILGEQGHYQAIDMEWTLTRGIPVGWLLYRTLLLHVQGITRFGRPGTAFLTTRRGYFLASIRSAGFDIDDAALDSFAAMEAEAQAEATGRPVQQLQNWWADSPLPIEAIGSASVEEARLQQSEARVAYLQVQLKLSDSAISTSRQQLEEQVNATAALRQQWEQSNQIASEQIAQRDRHIAALQGSLLDIRSSTSWKTTAPLRAISTAATKIRRKAGLLPDVISAGGGLAPTLKIAGRVLRTEGLGGVRLRLANMQAKLKRNETTDVIALEQSAATSHYQLVPFYPNPLWDDETPQSPEGMGRLAVHCHLAASYDDTVCLQVLAAIPTPFDLYVTIAGGNNKRRLQSKWKQQLPHAGVVQVEDVATSSMAITALLGCFGNEVASHAVLAHFNFQHPDVLPAAHSLVGDSGSSGGRLAKLLGLIQATAGLVLPFENADAAAPSSVQAEADWVARIAHICGVQLDEAPAIWPVNGAAAFLARGACLQAALPAVALLKEGESNATHAALLANAMTAFLPALSASLGGGVLCIQKGDSTTDFREYESQRDYAGRIVHRDVKVLCYYLPQFHPTPENDEWHGKGFTEWTKVRGANPLFQGHYQQHIPHPDIGYYLLDSPDTLRLQAEQMRQAGVHGQVFYHYWFSGRMILEKPAQMLLAHPDIAMPYCFCWANENWTRRWDGNEREILLGQTYSADDARAFIRYLIPFFRDPRYIRVGTRPVLMVYRPSSMPDPAEYVRIWADECRGAGVNAPYVMAVLTRGATNPADFHMDAGVERPLHDWTDGAVSDIRPDLQHYWPMNGSALPYDQVRDFYTAQNDRKDFDYIRSNVPMWDNTARYGSEALLLHGSTPQSFQAWMEHSIADAQEHLRTDRRFVVVNAWNEWAEGTHLEPDTRYGYSYLNSVGRALSGLPYTHELNASASLPDGLRLQLHFTPALAAELAADPQVRKRFFHCLSQSRILRDRGVFMSHVDHTDAPPFPRSDAAGTTADLRIDFRRAVHFGPEAIERMVYMAIATRAIIVGNDYGDRIATASMAANGQVQPSEAGLASVCVQPCSGADPLERECRVRSDAWCFALHPHTSPVTALPQVTTILRFHRRARVDDLMHAISCLYVMRDCTVIPLIAAQDLDVTQTASLEQMLETFDWEPGCEPIVHHYTSSDGNGDLRSRMLNESLRKVTTKYAAFLDYDDLLFSDAYVWLLQRLQSTGKAVAFGRVYWTDSRSRLQALLLRHKAFEYGGSHREFVNNNHAPLHSLMIDVTQFDLNRLVYFDDQRFMEDYLMTLQLFTEDNADWDGLRLNHYVGDYIHSIDREHTLALNDDSMREALLRDPEYMLCEERITAIRRKIASDPVRGGK